MVTPIKRWERPVPLKLKEREIWGFEFPISIKDEDEVDDELLIEKMRVLLARLAP